MCAFGFWFFSADFGVPLKEFDEHLWFHLEVVLILMLWRANFQITLLSICLSDVFTLCWAGQGVWGVHYELWVYLTLSNDRCRWAVRLSACSDKTQDAITGTTSAPQSLLLCSVQGDTTYCSPGKAPLPPGSLTATAESNIMDTLNNCYVSLWFYLLFIPWHTNSVSL